MRISTISVGVQECEGMARESGAGHCQFADVRQFTPEFDKFACSASVTFS